MRNNSTSIVKLLLVFITTFSLVSLAGPISSDFHLPSLNLAHGTSEQLLFCGPGPGACSPNCNVNFCSYYWTPAGPSEDTLTAKIFTDETAEFTDLQSASPSIDFTDWPCTPSLCNTFTSSPNFVITSTISEASYVEVQFMLANNFWGCNFNYGNSTCGVQIRQGMAHMIDTASFAAKEPSLGGQAVALDTPNPSDNVGGLLPVNPCSWDANFPETGPNCITGAPGGTAYHLASAAGADGFPWLPAPGSTDMNAAAQHFVNAGLATGFNPSTSILTGVSSAAAADPVNFFIRGSTDVNNPAQLDAGNSLAAQTCYLFTGSYTTPCTYVSIGPQLGRFPGWTTSTTSVSLSWGVFIRSYQYPTGPQPFDRSLYFQYNSNFVSGIPSIKVSGGGLCASSSVPTANAADYMYLCDSNYDSLTSQMESASSLSTAVSLGMQAENRFGSEAYTIPVFERNAQFGYLNNGWIRDINNVGSGLPNYFTWLNAWNPSPVMPGTIRQGFKQTTSSVSPFMVNSQWNSYIVGNVYDSLTVTNPVSGGLMIDWMVISIQQLPNSGLTYTPPIDCSVSPCRTTTQTFRFTLRSDLFFQDGRKVTSFDVAFSYLALKGTGASAGAGASPMTGVTILGPSQFDINVNSVGPFTLLSLTSLPILPGAYWSNAGMSAWTSAVNGCTGTNAACYPAQYTIAPLPAAPTTTACTTSPPFSCAVSAADMNVNVAQTSAPYDPIANHTLVGSGPWECGPVTSSGSSTSCSSTGTENPPVGGSYSLTRFGKGLAPGSSVSSVYFRSNGNLALYLWSEPGDLGHDFLTLSLVAACYGLPVSSTGSCAHFQQGIGANGGPVPVGLSQVAIVNRFVGLNWVAPFTWSTSPPAGIIPLNPVLYENTITLNPASVAGCTNPYPTGGYDC